MTTGRVPVLLGMRVKLSRKPFCGRDSFAPVIVKIRTINN